MDSDGVARLFEISSVVKVFTCHALLGFWLLSCWVQFKVRSLSFSDNDSVLFGTCNQVKLSIYVSSVFFPKRFSASLFREIVIYCCVTLYVMVQKHRLGIVQSVDLLNMMQLMNILSMFAA